MSGLRDDPALSHVWTDADVLALARSIQLLALNIRSDALAKFARELAGVLEDAVAIRDPSARIKGL